VCAQECYRHDLAVRLLLADPSVEGGDQDTSAIGIDHGTRERVRELLGTELLEDQLKSMTNMLAEWATALLNENREAIAKAAKRQGELDRNLFNDH
jgi:hypothetical protein